MGWYTQIEQCHFNLPAEHMPLVLEVAKQMWPEESYTGSAFHSVIRILQDLNFTPHANDAVGITHLEWEGGYYRDEMEEFFKRIGKYVKAGSYMNWVSEDHSHFQWYFNGDSLIMKYGTITYSEKPMN